MIIIRFYCIINYYYNIIIYWKIVFNLQRTTSWYYSVTVVLFILLNYVYNVIYYPTNTRGAYDIIKNGILKIYKKNIVFPSLDTYISLSLSLFTDGNSSIVQWRIIDKIFYYKDKPSASRPSGLYII